MKSNDILRIIGIIVAGYFAVKIALWATHLVLGLLSFMVTLAIVIVIILVVVQFTTKKKLY